MDTPFIQFSYIRQNTDRSVVILFRFIIFLYTGTVSGHLSSSGKKPLSKHALKFLVRKPPKILLNSLIILSGMSFEFETFLESIHLIEVDICPLSTVLKVKVEFDSALIFNSKYTWMVIVSYN